MSRWSKLFGSPTDAARTILEKDLLYDLMDQCDSCPRYDYDRCVRNYTNEPCVMNNVDAITEWLMGDE